MRVVLDSNVFIAAVAARGICEVIVELCLERHRLISGEEILGEVEEKLRTKLVGPEKQLISLMINVLGTILAVLDCR